MLSIRKKWIVLLSSFVAILVIGGTAFSASGIKLIVNGHLITPEVPPQIIKGSVMVPIREVAEALGAKVTWNGPKQTVTVDLPDRASLQRQISLLQNALAPASADEAAKAWAKAVQTRNGAAQYALLSPELQSQTVKAYEELGWVTGVSSPWVDSFQVSDGVQTAAGTTYNVTFHLKTSTGSAGGGTVKLTVKQQEGKWLITGLQGVQGSGELGGIVIFPTASHQAPTDAH